VLWLRVACVCVGELLCEFATLCAFGALCSVCELAFVSSVLSRCPCLRGPILSFFK
jgi:hypothetical protein